MCLVRSLTATIFSLIFKLLETIARSLWCVRHFWMGNPFDASKFQLFAHGPAILYITTCNDMRVKYFFVGSYEQILHPSQSCVADRFFNKIISLLIIKRSTLKIISDIFYISSICKSQRLRTTEIFLGTNFIEQDTVVQWSNASCNTIGWSEVQILQPVALKFCVFSVYGTL